MRILAIETAHPPGSIAFAESSEIVAFQPIEPPRKTAASFAQVIRDLLNEATWLPQSVELVATTTGPGSFTGTRIGVTAAKVFAYSVGAKVVGINTLELIATQVTESGVVDVVMDAQRDQLFHARFCRTSTALQLTQETELVDVEWFQQHGTEACLAGPALTRFRTLIPQNARCAPRQEWIPRADQLAQLAFAKYQAGEHHEPLGLVPNYYRKSAAEEKADSAAASE